MRYTTFAGAGAAVLCGLGLLTLAGCGGTTNSVGNGGADTPSVIVTPNPSSITTAQGTTVTVTVSGSNGTPTGSVTLLSGSYTSSATTLVSGSAQIAIPAGKLAAGTDTLSAAYTPDSNSSSTYNSASGMGSVTVTAPTPITPTVTVSANPPSITTTQSTTVTVTVSGSSGTPTGSVTLLSGSYTSSATTLVSGSAQIAIPAGALAIGTDTLAAAYTPDANSSATYKNASGTGSVIVSAPAITPTVTVSANPSSILSTGSTMVTMTVSGGSGNPTATGSVTLTSGTYNSGPLTLAGGSVQVTVQGSALATGNNVPLSAAYTPDANSLSTYNSATGVGSVTVTVLAITSFTADPNPIPYGSTSTQLTAVFTGGAGVITPGSISATSGTPVTVSPTGTTVYTLTVTPATGTAITQTISVSLASAGVSVNPANPGIAMTDQILGMNMAAWYDIKTNSSAIQTAFQTAGIKAVRWPGGSMSDAYHWATNSNCDTAPFATNYGQPNGNDTFANFVTYLAAPSGTQTYDVALTADYGTNSTCNGGGEPSEAAAWVTAALNDGITVSHMTVGNEVYGTTWEEDLHSTPNDPGTYAAAVDGSDGNGGYYTLIKAASPNTLVGVVVDADNLNTGWDKTVLTNAVGSYDFVEYHYYPETPGQENDGTLIGQDARNLTSNINTIKSELTKWGTPNTPIYVGEIGAPYSNPGKQSWSITQGLYAGQVLGEMMNDGVSRLTWWIGFGNCNGQAGNDSSLLYGWQNFGAYNVFSDGSEDSACNYGGNAETTIGTMSPTAIAFDLFSNVAVNGENVLTPTVAGDTTDVVAYSATHSGGTATAIVLFNRNETTSEPVTITLTNKSGSLSQVTEYTYDKQMYDYTNTSCATDPTCTFDSNHDYSTVDWVGPSSTSLGSPALPLTVTLAPWSMNVFIIVQ